MKVIHVIENIDEQYGGPAKSVPYLCKHLMDLGVETEIHSVERYKSEKNSIIEQNGIPWKGYVWLKCSPDINIYEWQPKITAKSPETVILDATKFIDQNGKYILKFDYKDGAHGLGISRVAIYDADNRTVAEDKHNGFAGARPKNNIYSLRVSNWHPQ